jgi:hypothetical protein
MEELRMDARRKALQVAKTFGWPLGGEEYQEEFDAILDKMILEDLKKGE